MRSIKKRKRAKSETPVTNIKDLRPVKNPKAGAQKKEVIDPIVIGGVTGS